MKRLSFINKIIYFINILFALVLLLSFILPFLPPKAFSFLSVLNLGVSLLIIVNIIFALYWGIRLKRQFFLSFAILFLGYIWFGSLYKFASAKRVESPNNIKVMNYNVRLFNLYNWIKEDNVEEKIEGFLRTESPDILSVQEYHPHKNIDLSFFEYKFEKLSGKKTKYGQAIFSRFPIINSGSIEFPDTGNNAIYADVVRANDTFRIYNIHLESLRIRADVKHLKNEDSERLIKRVGNTFKMQQFQAELFLMHKDQCKYKTVVCGDFNNTAFSYVYRKIKGEDLQDAYAIAGSGFGRTHEFEFFPMRIDFVLADKDFNVNGFKSYNTHYSDHFPIMATVAPKE
ncbi:endonuclease/exonuclease/phosphatase family protein [Seonamhaeicola marinus]|uniref:Endonuclease n=1 Tax=Seonamhaeicola marinus TaxID=1912246 RepID=A0A5D0IMG0_9FLAO|nr:endonuclease/exonuclease/phosphatase family protein [Seonamhaeicola marinus]TYA84368.1 endonuclease [Seonamhaeicola marinus]